MGQSVLVFISHSSEDKIDLIEPIVNDLENCFINVWLDKRKIVPGDNLRTSIFREGIDKADIALIFFTKKSLESSWVDKEIKHVLRGESQKGSDFDLNKIISIFDTEETYIKIVERYPELTDDLLHLMPVKYDKIQLGQLISAIWSKYFSLQGGDIKTQKQLLGKDKELFRMEKQLHDLKEELKNISSNNSKTSLHLEFEKFKNSGYIDDFLNNSMMDALKGRWLNTKFVKDFPELVAFGLAIARKSNPEYMDLTEKGKEFSKWYLLNKKKD